MLTWRDIRDFLGLLLFIGMAWCWAVIGWAVT